jgi:hypothetical protein
VKILGFTVTGFMKISEGSCPGMMKPIVGKKSFGRGSAQK